MAEERAKPNAPIWIKLFVAFHVVAITIWALPVPTEVVKKQREPNGTEYLLAWNQEYLKTFQPIIAYLFVTGFWQYWDMFSPNPTQWDVWCDADVTYRDGTERKVQYPRMFLLSLPQKYISERYRKFFERVGAINEQDPSSEYRFLWPTFGQRIAYLNDNPANPPVTVRVWKHAQQVMPPGMTPRKGYEDAAIYTYQVDQQLLAEERKGPW